MLIIDMLYYIHTRGSKLVSRLWWDLEVTRGGVFMVELDGVLVCRTFLQCVNLNLATSTVIKCSTLEYSISLQ